MSKHSNKEVIIFILLYLPNKNINQQQLYRHRSSLFASVRVILWPSPVKRLSEAEMPSPLPLSQFPVR